MNRPSEVGNTAKFKSVKICFRMDHTKKQAVKLPVKEGLRRLTCN